MKAKIHPKYGQIKVKMTDGTEFMVGSTYKKAKGCLELDVDPKTHGAWLGKIGVKAQERGQVARFMRRFKELSQKDS